MIYSQLINKLKSIIFDESHLDQNIMILSGKPITMKNDFIFSIASHIASSKSPIHYFDINSTLVFEWIRSGSFEAGASPAYSSLFKLYVLEFTWIIDEFC